MGVESKVDLPGVGANLQDHPVVPMLWHTHGITDLAQLNNVRNFARWKMRGTGPLASNIGEAGAFFASRDGLPAPDLQIHMAPAGFYDNGLHEPTHAMVTAAPTLVSVASRGHLRLRSADPTWHPEIEAAYFDDQADLDAMLAGLRRTFEICTQGALAAYVDRPWELPADPSDEDLVEHARKWGQTLYHPTSTCAMGSGEDAVVDAELRVRGVDGLRVVDASVMPAVPRGNTNAPTIMIAEKAADLIKEQPMTSHLDRTASGTTFESLDPRTGDVAGTHPVNTPEEVQAAVDRAHEEAAWWGALSFDEREKHLQTWKGAMTRRLAQLAEVMHLETGKPHGDATLEARARDRPPRLGRVARREGAEAAQGPERAADGQPGGVRRVPAARRHRRDRAVELPGLHADGLDRLRAGGGQRGGLQAVGVHARRRRVAGPDLPRVRRPAGAAGGDRLRGDRARAVHLGRRTRSRSRVPPRPARR